MKWIGMAGAALIGSVLVTTELPFLAPEGSNPPPLDPAPVDPALREKFTRFLAGRFDDVPKKIDARMTLAEVTIAGQVLSFRFEHHDPSDAAAIVGLNGLEPAISAKLCNDPRFLALAADDAWAAFHVEDRSGRSIERFTIDPAAC